MAGLSHTLAGRWALVTGGHVRVGRAISLALAEAGMSVLVTYRTSPAAAESTVAELQALGVDARAFAVDLADAAAVALLADAVLAQAGPSLAVLVNSASVYPRTALGEISAETWDAILAANLRTVSSVTAPGPAYEADGAACLSFLPALPRLQGRIDLHDQRGRARVGAQGAGQLRLPGSGAAARGLRCRLLTVVGGRLIA